jgi:hypothetical protein
VISFSLNLLKKIYLLLENIEKSRHLSMDSIESNVKSVLMGESLNEENASICDFSLQQQIQELGIYLFDINFYQIIIN